MTNFVSHAQARRSRHLWMATLETHIVRVAPRFAGKVDWDTATFHFNEGRNPADAASLMVQSAIVREDEAAFNAHLDLEAERFAHDHSFDDGGMFEERSRHP